MKSERSFVHHAHLTGGIVRVLSQFGVHAVQTDGVSDFTNSETSFIENRDDPLVRLLHKINDDLVVEVVDLHINSTTVKINGMYLCSCM